MALSVTLATVVRSPWCQSTYPCSSPASAGVRGRVESAGAPGGSSRSAGLALRNCVPDGHTRLAGGSEALPLGDRAPSAPAAPLTALSCGGPETAFNAQWH